MILKIRDLYKICYAIILISSISCPAELSNIDSSLIWFASYSDSEISVNLGIIPTLLQAMVYHWTLVANLWMKIMLFDNLKLLWETSLNIYDKKSGNYFEYLSGKSVWLLKSKYCWQSSTWIWNYDTNIISIYTTCLNYAWNLAFSWSLN